MTSPSCLLWGFYEAVHIYFWFHSFLTLCTNFGLPFYCFCVFWPFSQLQSCENQPYSRTQKVQSLKKKTKKTFLVLSREQVHLHCLKSCFQKIRWQLSQPAQWAGCGRRVEAEARTDPRHSWWNTALPAESLRSLSAAASLPFQRWYLEACGFVKSYMQTKTEKKVVIVQNSFLYKHQTQWNLFTWPLRNVFHLKSCRFSRKPPNWRSQTEAWRCWSSMETLDTQLKTTVGWWRQQN